MDIVKTIPALDGLRAIAVLLVMAAHSMVPGFSAGFIGVDIFFLLSGFLITRLLIIEWDSTKTLKIGRFYIRRALRLLPALLFLLFFYSLVVIFFAKDKINYLIDLPIVLFYMSNWWRALGSMRPGNLGHTWSLSIEEQYYLIWPSLLLFVLSRRIERRSQFGLVLAAAVLLTVTRVVMTLMDVPSFRIYNGLDTRADLLLYGSALALWLSSRHNDGGRSDIPACPRTGLVVFLLAGGLAYLFSQDQTGYFLYGIPLCGLSVAGLILHVVALPESGIARGLSSRVMRHIGKISYGLYLWHYLIIRMLHETSHFNYGWIVSFPVTLALTFGAAEISYWFIEKRFLKVKDQYAGEFRVRPAGV